MPKIIVTSRYMKSGSHSHIGNYVKYIGTREGVAVPEKNRGITKSQTKMIEKLINNFPQSKELPEYEKFIVQPTAKTASECISAIIDDNMDLLANREIYMNYLGTRPNVVKVGSHGLFSETDEPIVLSKVAREVAEHSGTVWTHVVSLRRDDAERMGYATLPMWRDLVKRHLNDIAEAQKIGRKNLRWYAAFHDKENNPHVHIVVYSKNPKEGFLTNNGIEKIRSVFANDIYRDELQNLYQKQTAVRDKLRFDSDEIMKSFVQELQNGTFSNPTLENLIAKLSEQLKTANGKKVYGYLQPSVKQTVDEIVEELAENPALKQMYAEWCSLEQEKHRTYSSAVKQFPSLAENKVFKPIKNAVINAVLNMRCTLNTPECDVQKQEAELPDTVFDEPVQIDDTEPQEDVRSQKRYCLKWSNEYKAACNILYRERNPQKAFAIFQAEADKGNILAIHDIGKIYQQGLLGEANTENADKYFTEALRAFQEIEPTAKKMRPYVQYRIGKLYNLGYGTEQDYEAALNWLQKSAMSENKYAQYSLGGLYYYGNGTEQSYEKAFRWYKCSADKGNAYAAYETAKMLRDGKGADLDKGEAERYFKSAYSGFLKIEQDMADDKLWYRLGMMTLNGIGCEKNAQTAVQYLKKSSEMNNENALCEYGKQLIEGITIQQDIEQGFSLIEKSAVKNENARYYLGKLYLKGETVAQDIDKAIKYFENCSKNPYAAYALGRIYLDGVYTNINYRLAEKYLTQAAEHELDCAEYVLGKMYLRDDCKRLALAEKYLSRACERENKYAMYTLAKLYLCGEMPQRIPKAIELLERSASLENDVAAYALGKLYLFGQEVERDTRKSEYWLNVSATAGNEYAKRLLENMEGYRYSAVQGAAMSLLAAFGRMIAEDYRRNACSQRMQTEHKLKSVIRRKKLALGIKEDRAVHQDMEVIV